jgi:hypothetical protein
MIHQDGEIFVQGFLWEAYVKPLCTSHPVEVKKPLAYNCVVVEDFIELAELE